jgi:hypothetical protein
MLNPFHRLPMFAFAAFGFLLIAGILAIACWLAFKSGKNGTTKLGGVAGCFLALALVFVAGLAALSCTAIAALNAPNEILRHGPVRRIEAQWPPLHKEHDETDEGKPEAPDESPEKPEEPARGLHLRIELDGTDTTEISRWFREHTEGDMTVSIEKLRSADGPRTRVDIELPISDDDLRKIREEFERDLPNLNLPQGVRIELKGEDD